MSQSSVCPADKSRHRMATISPTRQVCFLSPEIIILLDGQNIKLTVPRRSGSFLHSIALPDKTVSSFLVPLMGSCLA